MGLAPSLLALSKLQLERQVKDCGGGRVFLIFFFPLPPSLPF